MKLASKSLNYACSLPIVAMLVGISACGGVAQDDDTASAALTGGTRVTTAFEDANPYVRSAVSLSVMSAGQCSGTKIGAQRYLTAGHCAVDFHRGNTITIANRRDPSFTTTVSKSFVHPSWRRVQNAGSSYDIGILDVSTTSSIPTWNNFDYNFVPDTQDNSAPYRLVAYGFANATCTALSGLKRWADFQSWSRSASPAGSFWDGVYTHNVMEYNAPNGCLGDSGGPLFEIATGSIVGVENATVSAANPPTLFTRIDKLKSFIEDPLTACRNGCDAECIDRITSTAAAAFYPECFQQCVDSNC
jgi:hypothetical protein